MKYKIVWISGILIFFCFALFACKPESPQLDDLEWTNDQIVYASIKKEFAEKVLQDPESCFKNLKFKKLYVTQNDDSQIAPLNLLFILEPNGSENQQDFRDTLFQDPMVYAAYARRDLPYKTINTLRIEAERYSIHVGETLVLEKKGALDIYSPPFSFKGFLVKTKHDQRYTVKDFPQVNLKKVEEKEEGWTYLELKSDDYFTLIKSLDKIARLSLLDEVKPYIENDYSTVSPPPAAWGISDDTIIDIIEYINEDTKIVIKGLKPGKAEVEYDGIVRCEITVKNF